MSDKVFTKKMTLSICLIILCLCALSISAGAFFSDSAKTGAKTFSTATYDLTITATKQVTTVTDNTIDPPATSIATETVAPDTADPHIYTLNILPDLDKDEGYTVKASIKEGITATSSGYCKIIITDKDNPSTIYGTYYTKQIAKAEHASADIKKFLDLGASGVQMGTRFVATHECDADQRFKEAYIAAKEEDVTIISSPVGMPGRALCNDFIRSARQGLTRPFKCIFHCVKTCQQEKTPYCIAQVLLNAMRGNLDRGFAFCGSNVFRVDRIVSVRELIESLQAEFDNA